MVEIAKHVHGDEITDARTSDARWIEIFAHYFVTQQHVEITTQKGITKESVVIRVNHHSVNTAAIYGSNQQTPFTSITAVRRIGAAEMVRDPHITRVLGQFADYMARGEYLRIETVHGVIERAAPRWLSLSGVQVLDSSSDTKISVSLADIKQVTEAS